MKFRWILALSALFIAGCAATFSVSGIAILFSGATLYVAIMASSLEIGKLVAASYLHRNWNKLNKFFKYYMSVAVIVLIFITSLGIYGFLSNAYQKTAVKVEQVEGQVRLLENKRNGLEADIERYSGRIDVLQDQRSSQEQRYDSLVAGEHWVNARRTYNLIDDANNEIQTLNNQIDVRRDSVNAIDNRILNIRGENMDLAREIGGFKFVAESFDVPIDTAVKWFILMLIFVFDPLAVSLVIAFNTYYEDGFWSKNPDVIEDDKSNKKNKLKVNQQDTEVTIKGSDVVKGLGVVHDTPQKKPNEKKNSNKR